MKQTKKIEDKHKKTDKTCAKWRLSYPQELTF